ncbi:CDC48 family AAA ATPase [Candidatus Bipolaricaulota bacterium]|nr:CDC48 family AAA ATPase [Candidatus Bipolaricaulota bacterium]
MVENERNERELKVAGANQQDFGKGIARISTDTMKEMGISRGDIVELEGAASTAGIAVEGYSQDEGLDIIRIDGLMRSNAETSIGDYVKIRKADVQEANKVTIGPASSNLRLQGSGQSLKKVLGGRPLTNGDVISTTIRRSSSPFGSDIMTESFFQDFFDSGSFGLGEIRLKVINTNPRGIVRVTNRTQIELEPEYKEVSAEEEKHIGVTYEDIGGLDDVLQKIREMVELPLKNPELFDRLGIDPPKGVLLHGPPGTGKTLLAKAVANETNANFSSINGPEIMSKYYGESEQQLREIFEKAQQNAPSIIFIDELDSLGVKREEASGEVERRVVAQLLALLDGLKPRENVVVIAATNRVDAIDEALRRPGRFDREIEVGVPDAEGRKEIFMIHTRGMPLDEDLDLDEFIDLTYGYTGSDIEALARESAMNALRRLLPEIDFKQESIPSEILEKLKVTRNDMFDAYRGIQPSAMREILADVPHVSWDDVGGLEEVKQTMNEIIELPLKNPESFRKIGIDPPRGILLYGPPGTGKTLMAKAVANESNANFITAKGSDLLSKWYGESEQRIAEVFDKARQVAPAIIFLDELDALAPQRGGSAGEPRATERIVNQLLSEMDGLEELRGVVVVAATNRPDMVDSALLRPGRFDELIHVPVPDSDARKKIYEIHTAKMHLEPGVDLEKLANLSKNFTGADIAAVCKKAGRLALREDVNAQYVRMDHFLAAIDETPASVTAAARSRYENIEKRLKEKSGNIGFKPESEDEDEG